MRAVDTNIVVRFLMADDEAQYERARTLFADDTVFIPKTVLLEAEWVLRKHYRLPASVIRDGFLRMMRLDNVGVEDEPAVIRALNWNGSGIDFADVLHLASAPAGAAFATFDQALARLARAAGGTPKIAAV